MRERRRKHDDVHFPMAGKGARGWRGGIPRTTARLVIPTPAPTCETCGCGTDTNMHRLYCPLRSTSITNPSGDAAVEPK